MDYKEFFKNKKITVLGLGVLGRGLNVTKFMAECGADLIVTDLKKAEQLKSSLKELKKYKKIKFVLGKHRLKDFKNRDFILKAAGVPLDSPYIKEAKKNKIPIEMDASLFAFLSPAMVVGVTGTKGKSSVTHLLFEILKKADMKVYLGGNVRGVATLPLLRKTKKGDIVVMELDSWQLQGFRDVKISPHIAIFTNLLPDHMNYYKGSMKKYFDDKSNIFKFQTEKDFIIVGKDVPKKIKSEGKKSVVKKSDVPSSWDIKLSGVHNKENIATAMAAAKILGVKRNIIKKVVEEFKGVPGRMEFIKKVKDVKFYNDTTATAPVGAIASLKTLGKRRNIILIAGGNDKKLDYKLLVKEIDKHTKSLILFPGTATEKMLKLLNKKKRYPVYVVSNMKNAVGLGHAIAERGDTVLLSPGATSFGLFINEFDRGDQFVREVKKLR